MLPPFSYWPPSPPLLSSSIIDASLASSSFRMLRIMHPRVAPLPLYSRVSLPFVSWCLFSLSHVSFSLIFSPFTADHYELSPVKNSSCYVALSRVVISSHLSCYLFSSCCIVLLSSSIRLSHELVISQQIKKHVARDLVPKIMLEETWLP